MNSPSRWGPRICVAILAAIACGIASCMSLFQWGLLPTIWDPVFGEQTARVLMSDIAEQMERWFRIPDAIFGALAYAGDALLALGGSVRRWQFRPWLVALFALDVILLSFVSIILVILQGTVVGYWCFLCLVTAAISLMLIWLAYSEVWACCQYVRRVWQRTRSPRILCRTIMGFATPEAHQIAEEFLDEWQQKRGRKETPYVGANR